MFPFLEELRSSLKDGPFVPLPVRQATVPKKDGKQNFRIVAGQEYSNAAD